MAKERLDKKGTHRTNYERNRKRVLKLQSSCGICKRPVDKSLKVPDPMAPVVDHIIPVAKGGHPSDMNNLQLAHHMCNIKKKDKVYIKQDANVDMLALNRDLPLTIDWTSYKSNKL